MTGYTSGKTTHDPMPYAIGSPLDGRTYRSATEATVPVEFCDYAPRPEYDNHNPILVVFRPDHENRLAWWTAEHHIETWLGPLGLAAESGEYPTYSSIWEVKQAATPEQLDHARRVLTKLAALTKEN